MKEMKTYGKNERQIKKSRNIEITRNSRTNEINQYRNNEIRKLITTK